MNDQEREQILSTIRKLAAIANPENGAFPGEIAVATRKMAELMDKYNVSMVDVMFKQTEQQGKPAFTEVGSQTILGAIRPWHWGLASVIDSVTTTRHFSIGKRGVNKYSNEIRGRAMTFFGEAGAAKLAADLFDQWVVLIEGMAIKAVAEYNEGLREVYGMKNPLTFRYPDPDEHPQVWRMSWLRGVITGMAEANRKNVEQRPAETSTALMVITTALAEAYEARLGNVKKVTLHGGGYNRGAYAAGMEVGRTLHVNQRKIGELKRIGG